MVVVVFRDEIEVIDLRRRDVRGEQGAAHRIRARRHGGFDPRRVPRREGLQLAVGLERERQVPPSHPHGAVKLLQPLQVEVLLAPQLPESGEQRVLLDVVGRQGFRDGEDARGAHLGGSGGSMTRTWLWRSRSRTPVVRHRTPAPASAEIRFRRLAHRARWRRNRGRMRARASMRLV